MTGSIEEVVKALGEAHVRYLVVGGVAVVLHGHLRTTADLDLLVQEPFDFRDASRRAIAVALETTRARVIGLDDLIAMKEQAGRPGDHEDVAVLRALRPLPGGEGVE